MGEVFSCRLGRFQLKICPFPLGLGQTYCSMRYWVGLRPSDTIGTLHKCGRRFIRHSFEAPANSKLVWQLHLVSRLLGATCSSNEQHAPRQSGTAQIALRVLLTGVMLRRQLGPYSIKVGYVLMRSEKLCYAFCNVVLTLFHPNCLVLR